MNLMPGEIVGTGAETQVKLAGGAGVISSTVATKAGQEGMTVNVGIRPEDMLVTEGDTFAYSGEVGISEALGEVTQIYFKSGAPDINPVIAKLPGIHTSVRGKSLRLTAEAAKVHLFSNGKSLYYQ